MVKLHEAECEYRGIQYTVTVFLNTTSDDGVYRVIVDPMVDEPQITGLQTDWDDVPLKRKVGQAVGQFHDRVDRYRDCEDEQGFIDGIEGAGADDVDVK